MKLHKTHKIGIVVSLAIALLIWGVSYLKGRNLFISEDAYHFVLTEVQGLSTSSPVFIKGYKVGQVRGITFTGERNEKLLITIGIEADYKLPKNTKAVMFSSDIMGSKGIRLEFGNKSKFHKTGDTLIAEIEKGLLEDIEPLKNKAENVIESVDSTLLAVRKVLNKENQENLSKTLANLETMSAELSSTSRSMNSRLPNILADIDSLSSMLANNRVNLEKIVSNFSSISDSLAQADMAATLKQVHGTVSHLNAVMDSIENGQGSLGKLVADDSLYNNLENSTQNLNLLLKDIKDNPNRYIHFSVFGRNENNEPPKSKGKQD